MTVEVMEDMGDEEDTGVEVVRWEEGGGRALVYRRDFARLLVPL